MSSQNLTMTQDEAMTSHHLAVTSNYKDELFTPQQYNMVIKGQLNIETK